MNNGSSKKNTIMLANIDTNVKEEQERSVFRVELVKGFQVEQIRIPRINNIVHSSLPKIENPSSETKPKLEVFVLDL